jgi:hypothetical protein
MLIIAEGSSAGIPLSLASPDSRSKSNLLRRDDSKCIPGKFPMILQVVQEFASDNELINLSNP